MANAEPIRGDGPSDASIIFVGERPNRDDARHHRPFSGKVGVELNRYLWRSCQITRDQVYVTYLIRDYKEGDEDSTPEEVKRDEHYLMEELDALPKCDYIIPLGQLPTRWFLGYEADMDCVNGIVHTWNGGSHYLLPVYNPAAGLHNTEFQARVWWGFEQLGKFLRGDPNVKWMMEDGIPNPEYRDDDYIPHIQAMHVSIDTEGDKHHPWGLSWSTIPGQAHVVRARRVGIAPSVSSLPPLAVFADVTNGKPPFSYPDTRKVLHNSLHDLEVLRGLGILLEDGTYDDTMVKAYVLGIEPQGLKALARRHCGMHMASYEETLGPASTRIAKQYLNRVIECLNKTSDSE